MHAAKGLEWDVVFVPSCEDGVIPHARSNDDSSKYSIFPSSLALVFLFIIINVFNILNSEKAEERRLMYVAMTRARERLFLTYTTAERWSPGRVSCFSSFFLVKIVYQLSS